MLFLNSFSFLLLSHSTVSGGHCSFPSCRVCWFLAGWPAELSGGGSDGSGVYDLFLQFRADLDRTRWTHPWHQWDLTLSVCQYWLCGWKLWRLMQWCYCVQQIACVTHTPMASGLSLSVFLHGSDSRSVCDVTGTPNGLFLIWLMLESTLHPSLSSPSLLSTAHTKVFWDLRLYSY